jgi:S-adenosylmethionine synthetase
VSEGHPDKIADQISDAIIDNYLAFDVNSKVACETLVTTNLVILAGEIKSKSSIDEEQVVREVIKKVGYDKPEYLFDYKSCEIKSFLHEQSPDINQGVERDIAENQGAGDQGIMFGYACNETKSYMPLALDLSHKILEELSILRRESSELNYLRPDSKSQVTLQYSKDNKPEKIISIVISTQHDDFDSENVMLKKITNDIKSILIPRIKSKYKDFDYLFNEEIKYFINPSGKFVIGGPHGDTGLTGRKIIVDTYGGKGAHGGGAFSGKDPSKVDRSAAYATRHIAKNLVAAGICDECLVQVGYAIGVAQPMGIFIKTYGTSKVNFSDNEIAEKVSKIFDMRPYFIEKRLKLRDPIYFETASYGHMGKNPKLVKKIFTDKNGNTLKKDVELYTWEKLDYVKKLKLEFNI